jgi:hypothetical protein
MRHRIATKDEDRKADRFLLKRQGDSFGAIFSEPDSQSARNADHRITLFAEIEKRWRRGEGVEPSGDSISRQAGFEDRWGHRAPSSSRLVSMLHLFYTTQPMLPPRN